ncbi:MULTISPECIES: hypothetical protein [Hymenobacter]|uniref:Uncharacterized protein n=1 Tax=Hymenobacter jejuensis TaxID=2502781 RepID=A0A5B7ZZJ1_9BACT|nr:MULTISPECIES: hypothetical protein [Hymenobacter]MBC6992403.1 hypothetical protein [Hymenobacter sp. BT491]QDA60289.1 hypothetical protein FHG12_09275 [Hymenobacter jejuensis]
MKNLVALLALLALSMQASQAKIGSGPHPAQGATASVQALDRKNGFGDATFGADISTFRNLRPESADAESETQYYSRTTDNLRIGNLKLTGISYGFYKNKLCYIQLRAMGDENCKAIHDLLTSQYGPGKQPKQTKNEWWHGKQVTMRYAEVPQGYATIYLASNDLIDQRMAQQKVTTFRLA